MHSRNLHPDNCMQSYAGVAISDQLGDTASHRGRLLGTVSGETVDEDIMSLGDSRL